MPQRNIWRHDCGQKDVGIYAEDRPSQPALWVKLAKIRISVRRNIRLSSGLAGRSGGFYWVVGGAGVPHSLVLNQRKCIKAFSTALSYHRRSILISILAFSKHSPIVSNPTPNWLRLGSQQEPRGYLQSHSGSGQPRLNGFQAYRSALEPDSSRVKGNLFPRSCR